MSSDPWNTLNMFVSLALLLLISLKLAQDYHAPGIQPYDKEDWLHIALCTMAVFVWVSAPMAPTAVDCVRDQTHAGSA